MLRSQQVGLDKERLARLGIEEETEEHKIAGEKVVKTEIVDEMFDFLDHKITLSEKVYFAFRNIKNIWADTKWKVKNFFVWRKLINQYRPWEIHYFLPMFVKHLEMYIDGEKRFGISTEECKDYKISTAQEAIDIIKRLLDDDYSLGYTKAVEEKWGKFPYQKTTYANGSVSYKHLTPDEYDDEISSAYEKARIDEEKDLKRLGEIIEKNMMDWWD